MINENPTIMRIANKQFKMIEVSILYKDIPEDGIVKVGKKKVKWYDFYKFDNKTQYEEWRNWAIEVLTAAGSPEQMDEIDMVFGLNYHWKEDKKEGQLTLL